MESRKIKMTPAQFARLHHINRRTLHYYDNIGLFSPKYKGENNYRYYDYSQSLEFEFIRMLKELNMSIAEIKDYLHSFSEEKLLDIIDLKQKEIDENIRRLKQTKRILDKKQEQILLCSQVEDMEIREEFFAEEYLLTIPYRFEGNDFAEAFRYIQSTWEPEQYRMGVGSFIPVSQLLRRNFDDYEGIFTICENRRSEDNIMIKPGGRYLCGYIRGPWEKLPRLYEKLLDFARSRELVLSGYSYEMCLNDFAAEAVDKIVTQAAVKIEEK